MGRRVHFILALFCSCVVRIAFAQPYVAVFSDGKRVTGEEIVGWHARDTTPTLDGTPIVSGDRQLRWFQNRSLAVVNRQITEDGLVEFVGGDRLPGRVIGCSSDSNADDRQLIVDTRHSWSIPNESARTRERVFVKFVQRICWRNRGERELSPGVMFLADGSQQRIRSLRWLSDGIQVLTADGQHSIRFDALAEIHLPVQDPQQIVMSERKSWRDSPLQRIETAEGLRATGAQFTFDAAAHSCDADRESLTNRISQIKKRRAMAAERNERSKRTHENLLATFERNTIAAEIRYANTLKRVEKKIDQWSPTDRAAWMNRTKQSLVERPKENVKRAIERHKELRAKSEKRVAELMKSTAVEIERLEKELEATDPTGNAANWYHRIHPAWSVNPLWVRFSHVHIRQSFAASEIPLTRLRPIRVVQRSTLGQGFAWRWERNVLGGPLRSAGREYGWGIGVHAENELHFELPRTAKLFRTLVALDASVGNGGCARAAIHLNDVMSKPIYQSPILISSKQVFDTGELELADERDKRSGTSARKLILVVHQQHDNRPENSDPFDIRDHVNWLEPIITLESN